MAASTLAQNIISALAANGSWHQQTIASNRRLVTCQSVPMTSLTKTRAGFMP